MPKGAGWTLPRVEIQKHQRVAEQLTKEIQNVWGLETCSLFVPSAHSDDRMGEATCAVLECVKQKQAPPAGTCWIPANVAADDSGTEDAATIRDALAELASYTSGEKPGPFARPGWLQELFRWAYEQTGPLGMRLTGNFRQYNASPTFSLVRIETDGPRCGSRPRGSRTLMSCRSRCSSRTFFPTTFRAFSASTLPGTVGCRPKRKALRSTN